MIIFQTFFVYLLLFFLVFFFFRKTQKTGNYIYLYGAIISYAVICGLRYGVGADFFGYKNSYEACILGVDSYVANMEQGFYTLTQILASTELHYGFYFGFIAFWQLWLISFAVKNDRCIYSYLAFTLIIGCAWLMYCNGLRQVFALCIWMLAIRFLTEKKIIAYYLILLLAVTMHKSAFILFIFYPLFRNKQEWFSNVKIQIILLLISLLMMKIDYIQNLFTFMEDILNLAGYGSYTEGEDAEGIIRTSAIRFGLGFYITLLTNIIIIYNSNRIKEYVQSSYFTIIYNLFFIGVLLKYAFIKSQLVSRINNYFIGFYYIAAAFALLYLFHHNKKVFYVMVSLFVLTFISTMYRMDTNTAMYLFNFQHELFFLKRTF